ncbi:hypothetical protein ACF1GT_36590, partial [Streptomyces sp. NPDC014636]
MSIELPTYVSRDIDADLHSALRRASEVGGFILLVGPAACGKTRCAYEAINAVLGDWRLCMPSSAERLTALVDTGTNLSHTVVWLNETQRFLGPGRLKAETIRKLLSDRTMPVVLIGTIWPSEYTRLSALAPVHEGQENNEDSKDILSLSRRFTIQKLSQSEQERAQELAPVDPRLAEAITHGHGSERLTELLAAAPELIDKWEQAEDAFGAAIVSAGVDARLCGHPEPLPAELLEMLALAHLSGAQRAQANDAWATDALRWACMPVRGAAALLTPDAARIGHVDGYRVTDILIQHAQGSPNRASIPERQWTILTTHATPSACLSISSVAYSHGRPEIAEIALRRALESGLVSAAVPLGLILFERGATEEAHAFWEDAVTTHGALAANYIGFALFVRDAAEEARTWWERAVEIDGDFAAAAIGHGFFTRGLVEEARVWWERAVGGGGHTAAMAIGHGLFERGAVEEAR